MQQKTTIMLICILTMLASLNTAMAAQSEPETLYFAPLPMNNTKYNFIKAQPVTDYLSKSLQRPVEAKLYRSYDELLLAFAKGQVHLVELGPKPLQQLKTLTTSLSPLVSIDQIETNNQYRCVLAAPIDGLKNLADIQQPELTKVALTQPLSTCGDLISGYLLKQHQLNLKQMPSKHLGSHEAVAQALIRNEYALGGLAEFIAERYLNLGLNILATSELLPPFVIAANTKTLDASDRAAIKQALLNYQPSTVEGLKQYQFSDYNPELTKKFEALNQQSIIEGGW